MLGILFHIQTNIAHRDLIIIFMLENQHAAGNAQATNIKRPAAIFRYVRQGIIFRRDRRIITAYRFRLRRQLNHPAFQHHLLNMKLMTQQRP
ncbi:Uncharacterised protein [Salmonella enterica subsp. enterica serovar Typhi]|nr:Uncharacterised protein [Salmonella enterica subsp. enterica serovar Typhi]CGZ35323.1 Uncharacterised protein [Salmonella enterica subsp. enterica serovar Typhi]